MSQPAPSEYFDGIDFNYSFYTNTGGTSSLDLGYVNSNFLKSVGDVYSSATTTQFGGTVQAASFIGDGSEITDLSLNNIEGIMPINKGGTGLNTLTAGQILIGNGTSAILQSDHLTWDDYAYKLSIDGTLDATNILIGGQSINTGGGGGTTYTAGTGLDLSNNEFSCTITQYTDASLNLALATKAGDNITWNAQTNTFNVTSVSSGTTSLTSANEGTNITISNGTINVGQVEDSVYKLPYTSLKKPAIQYSGTIVPIAEPLSEVSVERLYPSQYARQNYFSRIDGVSPDPYNVLATYAGGTYNVAYSTYYAFGAAATNYSPHYIFNKPIPDTTYSNNANWAVSQYDASGDYTANTNSLGGINGDWITIEMPVKILLTRHIFVPIVYSTTHINRAPRTYTIFGRNSVNDAWEKIIEETIASSNYNSPFYTHGNIAYNKVLTSVSRLTGNKKFNTFGLVANKTLGFTSLALAEWELFGTGEEITPITAVDSNDYKYFTYHNFEPTTITGGIGETYFNINFPETTGTLCDMLILGNSKYQYFTDISLNGLYNITVSNTSSIVKSDNSITYDYNLLDQPATNNPITGQTATYTQPRVIIRYKTIKGELTPYTPSGLLEYKNNNWVVNGEINSKITALEDLMLVVLTHLNLQ